MVKYTYKNSYLFFTSPAFQLPLIKNFYTTDSLFILKEAICFFVSMDIHILLPLISLKSFDASPLKYTKNIAKHKNKTI